MDRDAITKRVITIVSEQLSVDEGKVTPGSSFIDDLNADSLDRVELVMAFEEDFGFEIGSEDADKIVTVKDAVDYIEKYADQSS